VAVQFRPRLPVSLATVAASVTGVPTLSAGGGGCVKATEDWSIVRAYAAFAGVVAGDAALMIATPSPGIVGGAVYVILPPLAVCAGDRLKVPHGTPSQVAVQSTPRVPVETVAASDAVPSTISLAGGGADMVTTIGAGVDAITVPVAIADSVGSAVDVAVIVTVVPVGIAAGLE
jgi:hypothetical protein